MTNSRCDPRSISAHYEYDPFGNGIITTGTFSTENNFRFSSKWFDVDGKLYYYGHRYYNSSLGRWINRDKIDDKANIALLDNALDLSIYGENFYSFSGNEPLLKVDYLGLSYINPTVNFEFSPKMVPVCPKKCCNGKIIQLVPIWNCTRKLGGMIKLGPLKHGYICCNGENDGCLGIQKYKPSCMDACLKNNSKKYCQKLCYANNGDPIEPEVEPIGTCTMKCVSPDEKNTACNSPAMPWNYDICKGHHCYSWADDATTSKCK